MSTTIERAPDEQDSRYQAAKKRVEEIKGFYMLRDTKTPIRPLTSGSLGSTDALLTPEGHETLDRGAEQASLVGTRSSRKTDTRARSQIGEIRSEGSLGAPVDQVTWGFLPAPRGRGLQKTWKKTS